MTSPGSQRQSGIVTLLHPWNGGLTDEIIVDSPDNRKAQCHKPPSPLVAVPACHSFPSSCFTVISPVPSRNPGQAESLAGSISCFAVISPDLLEVALMVGFILALIGKW
uniref:Uncharacterized protein n=1 Tax=Opuntia streptacantha TaxID=393608 RepID=A0A7C8YUC7_OPUST